MKYPCLCLMAVGLGFGAAGLGGCSLISSDVTNFDLTLPDKKFTIDASGWQIDTTKVPGLFAPDGTLKALTCSTDPMCNSAVELACQMGCSGTCSAVNTCNLSLDVSHSREVNLVSERPELKSINDEPVIKVAIDSVTYDVTGNTLNVATPTINVYVGPTSVVDPTDPSNPGTLIGTIPPIPAGSTTNTTGPQMLMFTPTGKAELIKIMSTFKTPFNVLVGSRLLVTAGQPVPTGKLDSIVHIKAHAGL